MVRKSLNDAFVAAAPAPSATLPGYTGVEVVDDLDRILALDRRQPLNCQLDPLTRRYDPKVEALVRVMTARYGRGQRVSCACRPRVVRALPGDRLLIARVMPEGLPPVPPTVVDAGDFAADHQTSADEIADAQRVGRLRPGQEVRLPAADGEDGHFCIDTLNAIQAWSLYEIPKEGGALGFVGVGGGKSGLFILLPIAFGDECELAVLFIEPNQRQHYVSQYRRVREHFRVPWIVFEDGTPPYIVPGAPILHLLPYSKLGSERHPVDLDTLNPNLLLADEGHRLTGKNDSAGRRRFKAYVAKKIKEREQRMLEGLPVRRRAVYVVIMSGTLEDKSVEDTQPVGALALGTSSPLPITEAEASKWSQVFDPVRTPDRTSTTARRLQRAFAGRVWAGAGSGVDGDLDVAQLLLDDGPEKAVREGYRKRRTETPGVISASAEDVGASLYFKERKAPKMPDVVAEALRKVREDGIRPDDEVIVADNEGNNVEAMIKIVAKQVALGCYYYWSFSKIPCTCKGQELCCDGCKLITEWYARRKRYGQELRSRLLESAAHLDSPKLCKNAAIRAAEDPNPPFGIDVYCVDCREAWPCGRSTHLPAWRSTHWKLWSEIENKVPHEQKVKWVGHDLPEAQDPATHPGYYMVRDTVKYARENLGVVWSPYGTAAYGQKVAQLAKLTYHGGGPNAEKEIRAETGKESIIASLKAWGKGFDGLQLLFFKQLFTEMPSSNRIMEQALGRLVRRGQKSDSVFSEYYAHVVETRTAIRRLKARAEFNQEMGEPALVLAADFDNE